MEKVSRTDIFTAFGPVATESGAKLSPVRSQKVAAVLCQAFPNLTPAAATSLGHHLHRLGCDNPELGLEELYDIARERCPKLDEQPAPEKEACPVCPPKTMSAIEALL
jgi:hypothetical protein